MPPLARLLDDQGANYSAARLTHCHTAMVNLDHGSRYVAEDANRSKSDKASNDDVNAQLKPVDTFIGGLVVAATRPVPNQCSFGRAG
ncbi:MAG: hypothetical protein Q8O82_01865 [Pseudorhodobacter sp.]|nr:hypothetical protein [Pseudorhodobacter sp.]